MADYPVKTEPVRKADSQYSYTFTGWDDMETGRKENLTGTDTVHSPVTENKNYIAVYRKIPKEYTVTLEDAYGNVVETITAAYGKQMPDITLPVREDGLFAGYYLQKGGRETCYYSTSGEAVRKSDIVQDETFYAYWINPVSVTKQPVSVEVESDYEESYMEVAYAQSTEPGYTITPQWYMQQNGKKTKVVNGNTVKCKIPSGYKAGKYTFWCELTVVSEQNGQQIKVSSNQAALQVNQAAEPPKKEDTKPTTPDQDKDNSTGNPGDTNNGSTTKPDNTDNGISGKNDNSSNGTTSKSDILNNLINGVPGKNDITNINDVTFVLADGLNQIQPPVNSNNTKTEEAPAIENDIQLLTTIPDDTPWESHTSADNTPWINNIGTDDNTNHDQDAISPQNPAAYQAELGRANASFLVGLSILGLIAILLLILFLSNNRADRCAEE